MIPLDSWRKNLHENTSKAQKVNSVFQIPFNIADCPPLESPTVKNFKDNGITPLEFAHDSFAKRKDMENLLWKIKGEGRNTVTVRVLDHPVILRGKILKAQVQDEHETIKNLFLNLSWIDIDATKDLNLLHEGIMKQNILVSSDLVYINNPIITNTALLGDRFNIGKML
jgi:hypothetical protein